MADHQFLVEKRVEEGRTNTSVRQLSMDERVGEVARMLGGADGSDESARSHARHMLDLGTAAREETGGNVKK